LRKFLFAALLSIAAIVALRSQTIDQTNVLVTNATIPAGITTSGSVLVPANLTSTDIAFYITAPVDQLDDPTNGFALEIDRLDGDGIWREEAGFTWVGGKQFNKQGQLVDNHGPSISWNDPPVGKQIRFVLNNQKQMTGVTVTQQFLN
jgi:hypothetical protein